MCVCTQEGNTSKQELKKAVWGRSRYTSLAVKCCLGAGQVLSWWIFGTGEFAGFIVLYPKWTVLWKTVELYIACTVGKKDRDDILWIQCPPFSIPCCRRGYLGEQSLLTEGSDRLAFLSAKAPMALSWLFHGLGQKDQGFQKCETPSHISRSRVRRPLTAVKWQRQR